MIPFNRPQLAEGVLERVEEFLGRGRFSGDGAFTRRCEEVLRRHTGAARAMLTPSGTAALEMAAILAGVGPGDEVIMPSFTFPSTANAFVLRGAVPVFVDIRSDTLNLDERLVEAAITPRTRALVLMHYAGVACEADALTDIARRHGLVVVEDAAQALGGSYRGRPLGALGDLAAYSFHESKNISAGEGGALVLNHAGYVERAEVIREKGTNRTSFARGEVDFYTWLDVGSSFLPAEMVSAFLSLQLEDLPRVTRARRAAWGHYHERLRPLEESGWLRRAVVPDDREHNGHGYHLIAPSPEERARVIAGLKEQEIAATTHYVPLHGSPAGRRFGRASGSLRHTEDLPARLLRLPLWEGVPVDDVVDALVRLAPRSRARGGPKAEAVPVAGEP